MRPDDPDYEPCLMGHRYLTVRLFGYVVSLDYASPFYWFDQPGFYVSWARVGDASRAVEMKRILPLPKRVRGHREDIMDGLKIGAVTAVVIGLILMSGCAQNQTTVYRMVEGKPEPVATISQSFASKGCLGARSKPDGSLAVVVKQWGSSDWSLARMFSWIADVAHAMPIIGGGGNTAGTGMQGPEGDPYDMDCNPDAKSDVSPGDEEMSSAEDEGGSPPNP